jgi:hypothetical protein
MKSILVFIDGTICDGSARYPFIDSPDFYQREKILGDHPVRGSIECLNALSKRYEIVYIGARPEYTSSYSAEWLENNCYPKGPIYLAKEHEDRMRIVRGMKGKFDFIAGIGDRWDDNELHLELGCLSIILQEHEGRWDTVFDRIEKHHRQQKLEENQIHLRGKVEGLARVCPLLLSRYGERLWEAYLSAVLEMAENSRDTRKEEDLASFRQHNLDPTDLRDAARWDELNREEDWENNSAYGLQSFESVKASKYQYSHKVTWCLYADLWKKQGRADIGYQIHCRTDFAWWDRPAWNPEVRFEQPSTIMQGDDYCLFIQSLPDHDSVGYR